MTISVFLEIFQVFQNNYSFGHLWIAASLTHIRPMLHLYRNKLIDLAWKSIDWFLHGCNSLRWIKFRVKLNYFLSYFYHYFDHFWLPWLNLCRGLYTIKSAVLCHFQLELNLRMMVKLKVEVSSFRSRLEMILEFVTLMFLEVKKKLYGPYLWMEFKCLKQKFLVLIWLTSKAWKAESNLELPTKTRRKKIFPEHPSPTP